MAVRSSKRLWVSVLVGLMAAGLLSLGLSFATPASASAPLRLTFEKETAGLGVWEGSVSGDVDGDLTTVLTTCTGPNACSGQIWHVEFDWIIHAGAVSFTAHLSGILNNATGAAIMNGTVVDGFLQGAQVHEEGQLVNAATLRFEGTISVMPATA
ncbi:MAG TPA: hypothetical protein VFG94_07705 [Acidimicrobiales bacterium]|nr:hypothetical protein [Acidimicrobiales bacterium]